MIPFLIAEDRITACLILSLPSLTFAVLDDDPVVDVDGLPILSSSHKEVFLVNDSSVRRSYSAVNKYQPTTLACDE
ncbi:hypothetical protein TNCV_3286411 [Trichonephila clavipes]|nr:hypothetical protein TNCV_3286411 [Trichonephila clavipes]